MKYFMVICWMGMAVAAHATPVMDQEAHDMLTSTVDENENADAVSRWGDEGQRKHVDDRPQYVLAPIQESSFGNAANRGPASVNSTRSPAGSVDGVIIHAPAQRAAPKTVARMESKHKAVQEVSIIANDNGFFPSTIVVTQGIPVRLYVTGASTRSQCFMLDQFGVRRQIRSNHIEEVTFTPDQSGSFAFTCPMNGAKGAVVVRELDLGGHAGRLPASAPMTVGKSLIHDEDFGI